MKARATKDRLQPPLGKLLDEPLDQAALDRVRRRVAATRRTKSAAPVVPLRWAAAAAAVLALGVGFAFLAPGADDAPVAEALRTSDGPFAETLAAADEARTITLDDGSRLLLSAGSSLAVVDNGGERVVLEQPRGAVTYDIRPGGPRAWTIDAGALRVDVLGTRFTITRDGDAASVAVERGRVRVTSDRLDAPRELTAGMSVEVPATVVAGRVEVAEAPAALEVAPAEDAPAAQSPAAQSPAAQSPAAPRSAATPAWVRHVEARDYDAAFAALGPAGVARETTRARRPETLWQLADTARRSGHPALAVAPLERLANSRQSDARSGLAALTLGRLQLDRLDRPADAVESLRRAAVLGLSPTLAEVAQSRLIDALRRAGRADEAAAEEAAHRRAYPNR